jgi:four helix bundle protein
MNGHKDMKSETKQTRIKTHKYLDIWNIGIALVEDIYKTTGSFPKEEMYGLAGQMRRAAISVPSNISEGAARNSKKEFIQFLYISLGSLAELETQIMIAHKLDYVSNTSVLLENVEKLRRKLINFIKYLKGTSV